MRKIRMLM